jgi:hypothetical protein
MHYLSDTNIMHNHAYNITKVDMVKTCMVNNKIPDVLQLFATQSDGQLQVQWPEDCLQCKLFLTFMSDELNSTSSGNSITWVWNVFGLGIGSWQIEIEKPGRGSLSVNSTQLRKYSRSSIWVHSTSWRNWTRLASGIQQQQQQQQCKWKLANGVVTK